MAHTGHNKSLYEEAVWVPFVVHFPSPLRIPDVAPRGVRVPGLASHVDILPTVLDGAEPAFWPLYARYTGDEPSRDEIAAALHAEGLSVGTHISPAYNLLRCDLIRKKNIFPTTDRVPAFWRDTEYDPDSCPNVDELNRTVTTLPIDYRYTDEDITQTIEGFRKVWDHYFGG